MAEGAAVIAEGSGEEGWLTLEDGVQVQFQTGGRYRPGDFWVIPARMTTEGGTVRGVHPSIFCALIIPFGVSTGYVTVTLAYVLAQKGMTVTAIAALGSMSVLPQTWKVLWAPLADTTLTPRLWYLLGALGVGLSILVMSLIGRPASALSWLTALVMVFSGDNQENDGRGEFVLAQHAGTFHAHSGTATIVVGAWGGSGSIVGLRIARVVMARHKYHSRSVL